MQKYFDCGIDLGTTNSCVAISDGDHGFQIIDNQADRMQVTPSAVLINAKGRMIVGQRAYNSQRTDDLAIQFKRQMGLDKKVHFASANRDLTPEELSAEVLRQLKRDAEARLNAPVENVVITVPAAFKTLQSEATNKAGRLAGFKNVVLLQEPIAAAVAYGAKPGSREKHWMVFDYGGGTLDVAIITTEDGRLTVKNSEGDNYFGGSDIDRLLLREVVVPRLKEAGYSLAHVLDEKTPAGRALARRLQLTCEDLKVELSNHESAVVELFDIDDDEGEPIDFECEVTRAELDQLIAPIVDRAMQVAWRALEGAEVAPEALDKILLVGGSTFIPLVRERLVEEFKTGLDSSLNPMTVVAGGAAIYASTLVIDVEEEVAEVDDGEVVLSLTYDPISSEEMVNVIGKAAQGEGPALSQVRIDRLVSARHEDASWTSGWVDLLDSATGLFDMDVLLEKGATNTFKVLGRTEDGREVRIANPTFQVKHNETVLKTSAPPATMSIGVEVQDPKTGYDVLCHLIKKNSPLPAQNEQVFKLSRDIDPAKDDCITIKIWEGENTQNPEANFPAGEITIRSSAMYRPIPKGTEVELCVIADENRNIRVNGYIPDFDYVIPEETLRAEARIDLAERMDVVGERLRQSEVSLQHLKEEGVDVGDLERELSQARGSYDEVYGKVDTDESAVSGYIDDFFNVETRIIEAERKQGEAAKDAEVDEDVAEGRERVESWGDDEAKDELESLLFSYRGAQGAEERAFIAEKISALGFEAMTTNPVWLRGFFLQGLAQPDRTYDNPQKAEYWKSQAYQAIDNGNNVQLRNAVFELLKLLTSSAGQAEAMLGADLTL